MDNVTKVSTKIYFLEIYFKTGKEWGHRRGLHEVPEVSIPGLE